MLELGIDLGYFLACVIICYFSKFIIQRILSVFEISQITDRNVFITGCDSGFGNLLSRSLDAKGVRVFAGCLTETGANDLQNITSSRLRTIVLDVTNKKSVQNAYAIIKEKVGDEGLWGVVNNAGIMPTYGPAEWTNVDSFVATCNVNLFGTISVTLQFLPLLRMRGGRILNVSSVTANCPYPAIANYVVSKTGVKAFSGCLRRELLHTGVTVHSIEPGGFQTNLTSKDRMTNLYKHAYQNAPPDLQRYYGGRIAKYLMWGLDGTAKYVSTQPKQVADAMTHALLGKFPKIQYLVGIDTKLFFGFASFLPDRVVDYLLGWPKPYGEIIKEFQALNSLNHHHEVH